MPVTNLSGSNIQDTYQRVLHTDGDVVYDGTGSALEIPLHPYEITFKLTKEDDNGGQAVADGIANLSTNLHTSQNFITIHSSSFNGVNMVPNIIGSTYFKEIGSQITLTATGSGRWIRAKVESYGDTLAASQRYGFSPYSAVSGSAGAPEAGDVVEFKWDNSAGVGSIKHPSAWVDGTSTRIDVQIKSSSIYYPPLGSEYESEDEVNFSDTLYIAASISKSIDLTVNSLDTTTSITASDIVISGKTHITPQHTKKPMFFLGHHKDPHTSGLLAHPDNYVTYNKYLYFNPNEGGGGVKPDSDKPTFQVDGNLQVVQYLNALNTGSTDPASGILFTPNPNIYFFNSDASGSISGSHQIASASAQINFDTGSSAVKFFAGSTNEELIEVMHISRSGVNPRIGIGLDNPLTAFDFKSISDDDRGGELLIRGSRTTKGAEPNDEVGRINFSIDSGSYSDIKVSGSAAEIVAIVDDVDESGIIGSLSIRTAVSKTGAPTEHIHIGNDITTISGSLVVPGSATIEHLFVDDYARIDALRVGTTATDPGDGVLYVEDYGVFVGGLKVGSSEDPGPNNLIVGGSTTLSSTTITGNLIASGSYIKFPNIPVKSSGVGDDILILDSTGLTVKRAPQTALPYIKIADNTIPQNSQMLMFTGSSGTKEITTAPGLTHHTVTGYAFTGAGSALDLNAGTVLFTSATATNITASANISASGTITATSFIGNMDGGTF